MILVDQRIAWKTPTGLGADRPTLQAAKKRTKNSGSALDGYKYENQALFLAEII
jgi:hypothetical protein